MSENKHNIYNLLPGYIQGITRVCISYPFDYVRIYKQTNKEINIQKEVRSLGLFRGILLPIIVTPLDRAVSFYMYEYFKKNNYSRTEIALYPAIVSSIYMTPINIFNSNYIYNKGFSYKDLFKSEIKKNFYRGNGIEIFRNGISAFLFLYMYNLNLAKDNSFINGIVASLGMWSIVYPLDTIKTHKFVNNTSYTDMLRNTKLTNYYRGISLVYLKSIPSAGIGMFVYEWTKNYVSRYVSNK